MKKSSKHTKLKLPNMTRIFFDNFAFSLFTGCCKPFISFVFGIKSLIFSSFTSDPHFVQNTIFGCNSCLQVLQNFIHSPPKIICSNSIFFDSFFKATSNSILAINYVLNNTSEFFLKYKLKEILFLFF